MKNKDFIAGCLSLCGKPYEVCDCIGVVTKSLGIRCKGTNWLFRSINNSPKYRYLIERHACGDGSTPPPGAVVFKADENKIPKGYEDKPDAYHCGVVDEDGYVIHSSPKTGVRKDMTSQWTNWDYWGLMKQVEYDNENDYGVSNNVTGSSHDCFKTMSDREIIEAIYRAVVKD